MQLSEIPAVCISLDRRPDRWQTFSVSAAAAGIPVTRMSAVDARGFGARPFDHPDVSLLTAHNIRFGRRRSHYEIDRAGAIGASLSHFTCWKQLLASRAPALIVFEDDVTLPPDLRPRLERILAAAPPGWDMIQMQRTMFADGEHDCTPLPGAGDEPWQLCESLTGAYAYIVSRGGAEKLLARAYPIELHVDAYMGFMCRMGYIQMIWHPLVDIPPPEIGDTDIDHGASEIINLPSNLSANGLIAMRQSAVVGVMAMAAVAGGLVALAWLGKKR